MTASALAGTTDQGDPNRGARAFRLCAACHSVEPGRHLTGPSLAGVVGREAGTVEGFGRYSAALSTAGLTWDPETLDRWLENPANLVPGNSMRIRPVADPQTRRDLIAFLARSKEGGSEIKAGRRDQDMLNLKEQTPTRRVTAIGHCGDAYRVTLGTGESYTFWEFNLRFKTDSSPSGPPPGEPAIVRAGMQGDRAQIVFARPGEISMFVREECTGG